MVHVQPLKTTNIRRSPFSNRWHVPRPAGSSKPAASLDPLSEAQQEIRALALEIETMEARLTFALAVAERLELKQNRIQGGASSVVDADLPPNRVLTSNDQGKISAASVPSNLGSLLDSKVAQTEFREQAKQLLAEVASIVDETSHKQPLCQGAITSVTQLDLTPDRTLISDAHGKVAASSVPAGELFRMRDDLTSLEGDVQSLQQKVLIVQAHADTMQLARTMTLEERISAVELRLRECGA